MVWANMLFSGWLRDDPIAAEHGEAPPTGGEKGMGRNGQQSATAQLAGHFIGQTSNALPGKPLKSFYRTSGLTNKTWHWNRGNVDKRLGTSGRALLKTPANSAGIPKQLPGIILLRRGGTRWGGNKTPPTNSDATAP